MTTTTRRSPERAQFLADIITTAVEGGIQYWARVTAYRWYSPDLDGGTAEPGPGGTANAYAIVVDGEDEDQVGHEVGLDDIARVLNGLRSAEPPKYWNADAVRRVIAANRDNDAGDIDADDADVILQLAIFGEVVYG
jgi:hypothetical protein